MQKKESVRRMVQFNDPFNAIIDGLTGKEK